MDEEGGKARYRMMLRIYRWSVSLQEPGDEGMTEELTSAEMPPMDPASRSASLY
jgi:hypothetical protein